MSIRNSDEPSGYGTRSYNATRMIRGQGRNVCFRTIPDISNPARLIAYGQAAMNVREAIKSVRDDYVEQLEAMIALQRAKRSDVFVERRIERPVSSLFGKIYVPDVSSGDPMTEWLDLVPRERAGALPGFTLNAPDFSVEFENLWWDEVRLDHDGKFTGSLVSWWFDRWVPPTNPGKPRADGLHGFIHSVTVDESWICVDLGSATVEALFNILSVAKNCGARTVRVTSGRSRA